MTEEKAIQIFLFLLLLVVSWGLGHALDVDNQNFKKAEEEKTRKKRKEGIKKYFE